jgi:hypothetical protein
MVGECRANVSSPGKMVGECRANVSSPANFPKWPFWRVLEFAKTGKFLASTQFDKFAGEWPLLRIISREIVHHFVFNCVFINKFLENCVRGSSVAAPLTPWPP